MVKVFTLNENGKIELTKEEVDELISQAWHEGYKDGSKSSPCFVYPYPYWQYSPSCNSYTYTIGIGD